MRNNHRNSNWQDVAKFLAYLGNLARVLLLCSFPFYASTATAEVGSNGFESCPGSTVHLIQCGGMQKLSVGCYALFLGNFDESIKFFRDSGIKFRPFILIQQTFEYSVCPDCGINRTVLVPRLEVSPIR